MGDTRVEEPPPIERVNSSSASSDDQHHHIHAPVPIRPPLPTRKSSGTIIVPRDSSAVGPVETKLDPDDVRAMSPRRTSEDIEALGKEARDEMKRYVRGPPPRKMPQKHVLHLLEYSTDTSSQTRKGTTGVAFDDLPPN